MAGRKVASTIFTIKYGNEIINFSFLTDCRYHQIETKNECKTYISKQWSDWSNIG